jgi:methylase of polypeptide subunit release factors
MRTSWIALLALFTLLTALGWSVSLDSAATWDRSRWLRSAAAREARADWLQLQRQHWRSLGGEENIRDRQRVAELDGELAVFRSVFWAAEDTESLRRQIAATPLVRRQRVLEIGTGSGLVALCCLAAGAEYVLATDVNSAALANAWYNAQRLGLSQRLELRLVPPNNPQAFAVIDADEKFDVIV